jgi:hypothetical protein
VVTIPDLGGELIGNEVTWDFSQKGNDDESIEWGIESVKDAWYAAEFGNPDFALQRLHETDIVDLYRLNKNEQILEYLGLANRNTQDSNMKFSKPLPVFRFPFKVGDSWEINDVESSGTFKGQKYPVKSGAYYIHLKNEAKFLVDATGTLITPAGSFKVTRVRFELIQTSCKTLLENQECNGVTPVNRQVFYTFWEECIGVVARIESEMDIEGYSFSKALIYIRLGY